MDAGQFAALWQAFLLAPFPFILAVIAIATATWWFAKHLYSSQIESLTHRLTLRDDEVKRLESALGSKLHPSVSPSPQNVGRVDEDKMGATERPLVAVKIADEAKGGRVFVPDGRIFSLINNYREKTAREADTISRPYIGHWLSLTASVRNVREREDYITVIVELESMHGYIGGFNAAMVSLFFRRDFEMLRMLHRGDAISTIGRLERIEADGFSLEDCELIVAQAE